MAMVLVVLMESVVEWGVVKLVIILMVHQWLSFPIMSHTLGHHQQHLTSMDSVFSASLWPFILATFLSS